MVILLPDGGDALAGEADGDGGALPGDAGKRKAVGAAAIEADALVDIFQAQAAMVFLEIAGLQGGQLVGGHAGAVIPDIEEEILAGFLAGDGDEAPAAAVLMPW